MDTAMRSEIERLEAAAQQCAQELENIASYLKEQIGHTVNAYESHLELQEAAAERLEGLVEGATTGQQRLMTQCTALGHKLPEVRRLRRAVASLRKAVDALEAQYGDRMSQPSSSGGGRA